MILRLARSAALGFVATVAVTSIGSGQSVAVRVIEDGIPVQGVLLTLVDTAGVRFARTLTDANGLGTLRSIAGQYRVRAELIGRTTTETELLILSDGTTASRTIVLRPLPVELDGISVDASSRCEVRPQTGRPASVLWNEARKALEAEQIGRLSGVYRFDVERFIRELDPSTRRVITDQRRVVRNVTTNPFRSRPAEELADLGYLRRSSAGDILYAPTPDVLLSDPFLDTHCFYVVRVDSDPTLIGLGFEPVQRREVADVSGVLWLDESSAALRRIEFTYEDLPRRLPAGAYGGEATLHQLPSGIWVVQSWTIRSPVVGVSDTRFGQDRVVANERLLAVQEEGAEILRAHERGGRVIVDTRRATIAGMVIDADPDKPLAGATVRLQGTQFEATSGPNGRFQIAGVPEGEYTVTWTHPRLATSGFEPPPATVRLRQGETEEVSLVLPRAADLEPSAAERAHADSVAAVARAIGAPALVPRIRVEPTGVGGPAARVHGRVLDNDGRPLEAVAIEILDPTATATSNRYGRFTMPAVSPGRIVVRTRLIGSAERQDTLDLEAGSVIDLEIRLAPRPVELPPISVEVRSPWLAAQGFYDRREGGHSGHVITRADIERQKPTVLEDLLDDVPGVRTHHTQVGKTHVRLNRFVSLLPGILDGCEPQIWLDGQRYTERVRIRPMLGDVSHVENINFISPAAIEAIEIYVGNPPVRFSHPCGAILIWTRRGG